MSRKKIHKVKVPKIKVRKTWIRHPGERIVNDKLRPTSRELEEESLDEYEEMK